MQDPRLSCRHGLLTAVCTLLLTTGAHAQHIYWADTDRIGRAELDGTAAVDLLGDVVQGPVGLAVDRVGGRLFWTDSVTSQVGFSDLDGSNDGMLAVGIAPWALGIDPAAGRVYWTDIGTGQDSGSISRIDFDGNNQQATVTGLRSPRALAVDAANNRLFWSEQSAAGGVFQIYTSDLDGAGAAQIIDSREQIWGMTVDPISGDLYWSESADQTGTDGSIHRAGADGSNIETVVSGLDRPIGVALDLAADRVYFSDRDAPSIERGDLLDGGNRLAVLDDVAVDNPLAIALDLPPAIVASEPGDGVVDARQPSDLDGSNPTGLDEVVLFFGGDVSDLDVADFAIAASDGSPPAIDSISTTFNTVTIQLDAAITLEECTTIEHLDSDTSVQIGYLPGDVNGDGFSHSLDILALVDHLNGVLDPPLEMAQCDIDRSGTCNELDILREVDLLNGADGFDVWNGAALDASCRDADGNTNDNDNDNTNGNDNDNTNGNDNDNDNGSCDPTTETATSMPNTALPDSDTAGITDVITLSDMLDVDDVVVDLVVDHTWAGDVHVTLTHGGTTVVLIDQPGVGAGNTGSAADGFDVTLDDAGTGGSIQDIATTDGPAIASPPSYTPTDMLSAFDGLDASGDWTLTVSDRQPMDTGTLVEWTLTVNGVDPNCNTNGNENGNGNENQNGNGNGNENNNENGSIAFDLVAGLDAPGSAAVGEIITITLTATNLGPATAANATISFLFDQYLEVLQTSGMLINDTPTRVTWQAVDIAAGASATETVSARLGEVPDGVLAVQLTHLLTASGIDENDANNSAVRTLTVSGAGGNDNDNSMQLRPPLPLDDPGATCGACGPGASAAAMFILLGIALMRQRPRRRL